MTTPLIETLAQALIRLRGNASASLGRYAVRDWDECFAECDSALAAYDAAKVREGEGKQFQWPPHIDPAAFEAWLKDAPAPANPSAQAVPFKLPAEMSVPKGGYATTAAREWDSGWNNCLHEIAKLNATPPTPVALQPPASSTTSKEGT